MAQPRVVRTARALRAAVARFRALDESVALVPTMGSLHEGHLALVKLARRKAKRVVVSIFVNPKQFSATEDLGRYPRDEKADVRKLSRVSADLVFVPSVEEMYPDGDATSIDVGGPAEGLEGGSRPHFFRGVATVVAKLLIQCMPDVAVFGEKDFQQLRVVERMVRDLDLPVRIVGAPIVREADGLALSSRNVFLSPRERAIAGRLYERISTAAGEISAGGEPVAAVRKAAASLLADGFDVDYVEVRSASDLAELASPSSEPVRVLAAAKLGLTRLIDNVGALRA